MFCQFGIKLKIFKIGHANQYGLIVLSLHTKSLRPSSIHSSTPHQEVNQFQSYNDAQLKLFIYSLELWF